MATGDGTDNATYEIKNLEFTVQQYTKADIYNAAIKEMEDGE